MYTLDDYEKAKAEAKKWADAFDRYSGNNPDKYQSDMKQARSKLMAIELDLKNRGVLMMNDKEKLEAELNKQFPKAKHKQIVEYKGNRYQRKFYPLEKSRPGETVTEWGKTWTKYQHKNHRSNQNSAAPARLALASKDPARLGEIQSREAMGRQNLVRYRERGGLSMLKLSESQWDQLLKFQGYGNLKAPVWFLGIEEKLPSTSNRNNELKNRLRFSSSMDLAQAQIILDREIRTAKTKTWTWMSKFAVALLHPAYDWKDRERTRSYKLERLGRSKGDTFLSELFPLPAVSRKTNPCPERYPTREDYDRQVSPARIRWLIDALKRYKPRYVIIYGAFNDAEYGRLITDLNAQLVKKTQLGELYLHANAKNTTKILRFSFFTRGLSHNHVGRILHSLKTMGDAQVDA